MRDAVSSHVEQVFEVYGQQANTLDLDAVLQPSAASPSVADMLEWLQDIDRHFRTSYPWSGFHMVSAAAHGDLTVDSSQVPWHRVSSVPHSAGVPCPVLFSVLGDWC